MSQPSLAKFVMKRPGLHRLLAPVAEWYKNAAGYRQLGLKADDLIPEESDIVQSAIKRLSPKESYDRTFRLRRAFQCSLSHQLLPKEQWTKSEEDKPYLSPIIKELEAYNTEVADLDSLVITKRR